MDHLTHRLERTVVIQAPRDTVFRFFTDNARWAAWWGPGSTIEPHPGGRLYIRHPGGVESAGEVLEVHAPDTLVFTYGFVSGTPMAAGSSRVTIHLESFGSGTRLRLSHAFAESDAAARDEHVQGWRFQLSLFGNLVANEVHADAATRVDAWLDAWAEPNLELRTRTLESIAAGDIVFRDRFSLLNGLADVGPHITAAQHFMPGIRMSRTGPIRHCQGTVLADWEAKSADGQARGRGTNVFVFGADGRIESVTGFWS